MKKKICRCKSCGKEIFFIALTSKRIMPCDAQPIRYRKAQKKEPGALLLVTIDGKIARGIPDQDSDLVGYTSHFATCPNADQHRKKEGKDA